MRITTPRAFAPPRDFPNFVDHSIGREEIPIQAMSLVGIPYRWGGNTPDAGFDCSGLVRYIVARAADVNLPRTTAEMSTRGVAIEPDEIAPGDLVFFNTTGRAHSHVGIYVGKLRFVNAPSTGGTVRLDYLTNPYWAKHFDGIRRVAAPRHAPTPFDEPTYEANSRAPDGAASPPSTAAANAATAALATRAAAAPARTAMPAAPASSVPAYAAAPAAATPIGTAAPPAVAREYGPSPRLTTPASATAGADPFEPPPSGLSAAQRQARQAGASPAVASARQPDPVVPNPAGAIAAANASPDPIDAAADAFEPPPPTARAAAAQAQYALPEGTRIMRASSASNGGDDPIARFATGSN